ncbi:ATP-dependent Lhr-like helicase [Pseudoclavibacter sp. JAI123]|uniref:Lhr family ATP-dependent helicase n=1 Tax=Pseudoclavibacter sp. JAI123 TaxID=2723065 RepID=UPI0015C99393|nr:DEAD/DEAH box helicase [Pseudoclavibacter sp. JAI123]NYF12835.1 ATP-dependent Lhr-like helicase [Pseudoclavibacter sp. JAI123]
MPKSTALDAFSPATREWFQGAFVGPTAVQDASWREIADGHHTLVVAPTGSGKTLSAFLWAIDQLAAERGAQSSEPNAERRTRVVYLSPLKALGVDVERNLHSPLVGITQTARRLGAVAPDIRVGVRSGDTSPAERRQQLRNPPDILITTPESLYLMLTSQARKTLTGVTTVIIDEVHAVASSKRGAHMALTLERLDALLDKPAQRIGLSATVRPLDEMSRFLAGNAPVKVVAPPSTKTFKLEVRVPVEDLSDIGMTRAGAATPTAADASGAVDDADPFADFEAGAAAGTLRDPKGDAEESGSVWPHIEESIADLVESHRSTIVFVNSRRLAERLTARLNEIAEERAAVDAPSIEAAHESDPYGAAAPGVRWSSGDHSAKPKPDPKRPPAVSMGQAGQSAGAPLSFARAHHGSVSKESRAEVENALKSGTLRCVVATSSLELGIDMGDVDLVVQVESPPSVASGLQRVGRAGHQVGETSEGTIFPKHRADVLHSSVLASRMVTGQIERMRVLANPLDVLAQQTIAAAAIEDLDVEEWFDLVRRSAPFAWLSRPLFEATLDLLSGKYPSDQFSELRPRLVWDRDLGRLTGRPGAARLAVTSGGTIPDRGLFGVFLAGSEDADAQRGPRRVGELDEEMVYESRVGDIFALGATSWRIAEITFDRVLVTPAYGQPGRLPFWTGDALGRPSELGQAIGAITREIAAKGRVPEALSTLMDDNAVQNAVAYVREQQDATGQVPSDHTLIVERTRDELGDWRIILHSPYGSPVHSPWGLIVAARIRDQYGLDGGVVASDDGIIVRIPEGDAEPPGAELFALEADEIEQIVAREVGGSALFASRFREAAARALLLPRLNPGKRSPLWQQRQKAAQLLDVAKQYPTFPIILEAVREVLHDVYDLDALVDLAKRIAGREVRLVDVTTEQASPFARTLLFGYVGAFMYEGDSPLAERRAAALALDTSLLADLLGRVELRELLDANVIARLEAELQRTAPDRRARDAEGVADLLRVLGPISVEEIAERLLGDDAQGTDDVEEPDGGHERDGDRAEREAAAEARPGASIEVAEQYAAELVSAKRALRVRIAGVERIAAIEDASRLRDALGVALPIGVPVAFIDPVDDPVGDLVSRYARSHGPFSVAEVAERYGTGQAVVREALTRLELARRVVEGEFRPDREGSEWVDETVLKRLRARSLAALRSEIEPVDHSAFARFLPAWQHVGGDLRGIDGLITVIDQLAGVPVPASALETLILPARVRDYHPSMLDELTTAGEVLWRGHGAIGSSDGWISLHLADTAHLTLPDQPEGEPDARGRHLLDALAGSGPGFFPQLSRHVRLMLEPESVSDRELSDALWALVWQGRVTNDTLAPLRALLSGGPGAASTSAHRAPSRAARGRLYRGRVAMAPSDSAGSPTASAFASQRPAPSQPHTSGRWTLGLNGVSDATERGLAIGDLLLDRYGIVTRGSVMAEEILGGFALVYRVLARFEESGKARRGYFIEKLGAAQFSTVGAVDRLRGFTHELDAEKRFETLTLAATDPANPYGAALAWPDAEESQTKHRPGRKAGGLVTMVDGELALYVERGGKTLLTFTDSDEVLRAAARSLAETIGRARIPNLVIERVDGTFVLETPLASMLQEGGFSLTTRGLRMRGN